MKAGMRRDGRTDVAVALIVAGTLATLWTLRAWPEVSALQLPDADDLVRLQQIRDWLAGQNFSDLTLYRLGSAGVPMHWSRIPDLVPAFIIWALEDVLGRHNAEVTAVVTWPATLLTVAVWLSGRIARTIAGPQAAWRAMVVAVAAFPATTAFAPGRVDHHGLQLVLLLVVALAVVGRPSALKGVVGGLATALSIAVGVELAPLLAAAALVIIGEWVLGGEGTRERLAGLGAALLLGTAAASLVFRTAAWGYPACDGFTATSARAMAIASCVPLVLALLPTRSGLRLRCSSALLVGGAAIIALAASASECLSPYGQVPAPLQDLWLSRVAEARPLFAGGAALALAQTGLMFVGFAASAYWAWHTRQRSWTALCLLQLAAVSITFVQIRGASAGALLAAPALGSMIMAAQRRGAFATAGAWLLSGGLFYPVAAEAITVRKPQAAEASCIAPDLIATLGELQPGSVIAPIDTAAPGIAATNHRFIAGAYHRNDAGNLAIYSFFLGDEANARHIAAQWKIRWVVVCDGFAAVHASFARKLQRGAAPSWLKPVRNVDSGARIFEVVRLDLEQPVGGHERRRPPD